MSRKEEAGAWKVMNLFNHEKMQNALIFNDNIQIISRGYFRNRMNEESGVNEEEKGDWELVREEAGSEKNMADNCLEWDDEVFLPEFIDERWKRVQSNGYTSQRVNRRPKILQVFYSPCTPCSIPQLRTFELQEPEAFLDEELGSGYLDDKPQLIIFAR